MGRTGCAFTEKLPLELRREIYEDVLRDEQAAKSAAEGRHSCTRFNIPLFGVSKAISRESREVFFETNEIHIRPDQLSDLLRRHGSDVRQLRIQENAAYDMLIVHKYLEAAESLADSAPLAPRLKIVTFDCSSLRLTVRELVQQLINQSRDTLNLEISDFRCVDVGTYTLQIAKLGQEWRFSYHLLADLWPCWSARPADFQLSSQDIEDYFSTRGAIRIPQWVFENGSKRSASMRLHNLYGLAAQINCYGSVEDTLPQLKPQTAQLDVLRRFELLGSWKIKRPVLHRCLEFAGRVNLRDVRREHGSDVMEWATELLALNTKDFAAGFGQSSEEAEKYVKTCKSW